MKIVRFLLWLVVVAGAACGDRPRELHHDNFDGDLRQWRIEQMPGGVVDIRDGALVIDDAAGCTVWFAEKLTAPVVISYDATVVSRGGAHDRVSDLNCFWMAEDPRMPIDIFAARPGRTGKFEDYDILRTYYVGCGGNDNTTTRFRRYAGDGAKPLLPEYDLRDKRFLLEPNRTYHVRLVASSGVAEFWRDTERVFTFRDPQPLTAGWFAFRTVNSHLAIRNFVVSRD